LTHDTIRAVPSVLIVDDHPAFRATARQLLETEGFEVVGEAEDGASALECVARLRPEVVLLDVQLPDMDGFEVASRLCSNGTRAKVVLISSREAAEFGALVTTCGSHGFIPKGELSGRRLANLLE
jgi:DNA-binding NarL/FixJ family response regulator